MYLEGTIGSLLVVKDGEPSKIREWKGKGNKSAGFLLQSIHIRGEVNQSFITLMKFSY